MTSKTTEELRGASPDNTRVMSDGVRRYRISTSDQYFILLNVQAEVEGKVAIPSSRSTLLQVKVMHQNIRKVPKVKVLIVQKSIYQNNLYYIVGL